MAKLIAVGDTTFASDPFGGHRSYPVYTTKTGKKYYAKVGLLWYYATPAYGSGFKVGRPVKRSPR